MMLTFSNEINHLLLTALISSIASIGTIHFIRKKRMKHFLNELRKTEDELKNIGQQLKR